MGNCGSSNDAVVETATSPRNKPSNPAPSARVEPSTSVKADIISKSKASIRPAKKYKLNYFDFTGKAELIR